MAKYKKRPVVVDAEQFVVYKTTDTKLGLDFHGRTFPVYEKDGKPFLIIPTLEGNMKADNLDWIIKGIKGEIYPCKPNIFDKTYEIAEE